MSFRSKLLFQRSDQLRQTEEPPEEPPKESPPRLEAEAEKIRETSQQKSEDGIKPPEVGGSDETSDQLEEPDGVSAEAPPLEVVHYSSVDEILRGFRKEQSTSEDESLVVDAEQAGGVGAGDQSQAGIEHSRNSSVEGVSAPEQSQGEEPPEETDDTPDDGEDDSTGMEGIDRYLREFRARRVRAESSATPHTASPPGGSSIDDLFQEFFEAERKSDRSRSQGGEEVEKASSTLSSRNQTGLHTPKVTDAPAPEDYETGVISDILLQEERAVEATPPHLGALYLSGVAFVLGSIRALREGKRPDLDKGRELVREFAFSLQSDSSLLLAATWRGQDFSISAHSTNVAILAMSTAQTMGAGEDLQLRVGLAALLHEVGTVRLPKKLTQSEDKLSGEDLRKMRRRPAFSSRLLEKSEPSCEWLAEIVGQFYEREDGSGFPLGLQGDQIREEAKISGVVDYFDACIHKRPYRKPLSGYQTLFELTTQHSSAFPDRIVKGLIKTLSLYPYNEYVILSSGEIGRVIDINSENLSRPKVEILFDENGSPGRGKQIELAKDPEYYISKAITVEDLPEQ